MAPGLGDGGIIVRRRRCGDRFEKAVIVLSGLLRTSAQGPERSALEQ